MMMPLKIVLALGSNVGDRVNHLNLAVNRLSDTIDGILCSSIYETAPWGYEEQPYFLNMVLSGFYSAQNMILCKIRKFLKFEMII